MLRESAKVQLRRFHWPEIASFVRHLSPLEAAEMRSKVAELAPTGFQIWGIPSGAAQVLKDMENRRLPDATREHRLSLRWPSYSSSKRKLLGPVGPHLG